MQQQCFWTVFLWTVVVVRAVQKRRKRLETVMWTGKKVISALVAVWTATVRATAAHPSAWWPPRYASSICSA